ncbi:MULTISPECIES: NAD(P)H-binding protein [Vibrio]|uniref:NAD(P)H-binding protein n=1 Tax=Vibrio TaxID=662 RepID=UPI00039B6E40|nr:MULTISPECIES: NAD(P)H-binding protein [Vibrio]KIP71541.1 nucleoside-diphosphate sugar epimerase [Vibrio harveyi]MCF6452533.1 NAD(P)H-binding protein [Vibrio sp. MMG023]NOJ18662.1 NAD(P)H-binding protein [Vibrio jasicida]UQA51468.1 NAD(P)H-binding protein [Vibrio sp. ED002]CAH1535399.1 Nucleoside-diphosphate sugar epimerase [Vibrio jasicida]
MSNNTNACVIIAGATGLVGKAVINKLVSQPSIDSLYSLSRKSLTDVADPDNKIISILDAELAIHDWDEQQPTPNVGFICLGTTLKQAGSKDALRRIDVELVCKVAQQMKMIGVKRLAVVSSLGAKASSSSHYLACKGHMEKNIEKMGFDEVVFARPGPLVGQRENPRTDEKLIQTLFKVIRPLMLGNLANFVPIHAQDVAKAMIYQVFSYQQDPIVYLHRREMLDLIKHYD